MTKNQPQQQYAIGMVGLGVMGRNLVLNMAGHGFTVAGYDKDQATVEALRQESTDRDVRGAEGIKCCRGLRRLTGESRARERSAGRSCLRHRAAPVGGCNPP